jgi:hypothetical protein
MIRIQGIEWSSGRREDLEDGFFAITDNILILLIFLPFRSQ